MNTGTYTDNHLEWLWPTNIDCYRDHLAIFLTESVKDDGILGYTQTPSKRDCDEFVTGLSRGLSGGSQLVLIGRIDTKTVAMCCMTVNQMPNARHIAQASKAYLAPSIRQTRAVFGLLSQLCEKARALNVEMLVIDVREGSRAHRAWQRAGFVTFGILPDYSRVGEKKYRGHFMWQSVKSLERVVAGRVRCEP